mmetsp:Transcript_28281/g.34952  ORF Transcript_28281/g.34952 Transcript_28281/m.34952 type:complete len:255 (-) Transcript_28281:1460-2224(-)
METNESSCRDEQDIMVSTSTETKENNDDDEQVPTSSIITTTATSNVVSTDDHTMTTMMIPPAGLLTSTSIMCNSRGKSPPHQRCREEEQEQIHADKSFMVVTTRQSHDNIFVRNNKIATGVTVCNRSAPTNSDHISRYLITGDGGVPSSTQQTTNHSIIMAINISKKDAQNITDKNQNQRTRKYPVSMMGTTPKITNQKNRMDLNSSYALLHYDQQGNNIHHFDSSDDEASFNIITSAQKDENNRAPWCCGGGT